MLAGNMLTLLISNTPTLFQDLIQKYFDEYSNEQGFFILYTQIQVHLLFFIKTAA
jgi:hypothetical protein